MKTIAKTLRSFRKSNKLTLKKLSEKTGLSISYLSDMERGRTNPSLESCQKIANAYDIDLAFLLMGVEVETEPSKGELFVKGA